MDPNKSDCRWDNSAEFISISVFHPKSQFCFSSTEFGSFSSIQFPPFKFHIQNFAIGDKISENTITVELLSLALFGFSIYFASNNNKNISMLSFSAVYIFSKDWLLFIINWVWHRWDLNKRRTFFESVFLNLLKFRCEKGWETLF